MSETKIEVKPGEAINFVLEGMDDSVKETVLSAVAFYAKEKSDSGNKIDDVVKVNKLRNAYNTLVTALINTRLNNLNKHQRLFLNTGALADIVKINGQEITLLEPNIYAKLFETFETKRESIFSNSIYTILEKMKAIAEGKIPLIDTSGKKKRTVEGKIDPKKLKASLEWKKNDSLKAGANLIRTTGNYVDQIADIDMNKLKGLKTNFEIIKKYFDILQKGKKISGEEQRVRKLLEEKIDMISKTLSDFTKIYAEIFSRANEGIVNIKEKIDDIRQKEAELEKVENMVSLEEAKAVDTYETEHLDLIKRDITILNTFIVSAAERSPNRVPYSGARILLNSQIPDLEKANDQYFCTPENVIKALEKITSIHINAFPKDEDGLYIIPPILIEPIRNYVDFLEDRFVMGFVSGEPAKKGANVSFSPVDIQVMKAIGMYLAKDPIYNYRGEINEGTFMGDYTGKIEKKAQVKWTGEDKKFNLAITSELVDAASREDAVQDYIDFVFNVVNGLGPPPKMSKRKICVLLRYATIYSLENNVKLLLQYVAQSEPLEVRDTIVKYYNRNYDMAKDVVRKIVKEDEQVQRTLGNNPEFVIAKIFV